MIATSTEGQQLVACHSCIPVYVTVPAMSWTRVQKDLIQNMNSSDTILVLINR